MNPWSSDPCWQNFSSLYREVVSAEDAPNEIGRFHHLTASLYFGIASLEAFINQQMRKYMQNFDEEEVLKKLRNNKIINKLEKWPKQILNNEISISDDAMEMIKLFNRVRGDLTHPKTIGFDIYGRLEMINPDTVFKSVAEYIVRYYEASAEIFPYWLLGWNYLNPRPDTHEIIVINNQQFMHSLLNMGFRVHAYDATASQNWLENNMSSFSGYLQIKKSMQSINQCEPKHNRFPYQPKLCMRWWETEHHKSCGHVSNSAIAQAMAFDR